MPDAISNTQPPHARLAARLADRQATTAASEPVVEVRDLTKRYGNTLALDRLSATIQRGIIAAVIGPNGAGKSSFLEILMGLRVADSGHVRVLGVDVTRHPRGHVEHLGVQLQDTRYFDKLTPGEYLQLFSRLYARALPPESLAERLQLGPFLHKSIRHLSGGQRQRLALALAIVNEPELILLDEPTAGLDPIARREFWSLIRNLNAAGTTVLLSTHYMDEAQSLASHLVMIDSGRAVAQGSPAQIISQAGLCPSSSLDDAYAALASRARVDDRHDDRRPG